MNDLEFLSVAPKDHIRFKCVGCGACCRNVCQSVPIETLDAFRIAKYLRNKGHNIRSMDDFWEQYGEPAFLDECGYFIYFLKTQGEHDACVFLENNRCSIHTVNPRACRLYPFAADPETGEYLVAMDQKQHFEGPLIQAESWMTRRYSAEDRVFIQKDYGAVDEIARLLNKISEQDKSRAIMLFQFYKYSAYDLDEPFLPQFEVNQSKLIYFLTQLAGKTQKI